MRLALFGFVRLGLFGSVQILLIAASRVRMIAWGEGATVSVLLQHTYTHRSPLVNTHVSLKTNHARSCSRVHQYTCMCPVHPLTYECVIDRRSAAIRKRQASHEKTMILTSCPLHPVGVILLAACIV